MLIGLLLAPKEDVLYSWIIKAYKRQDFEYCVNLCEKFIKNYPSSSHICMVKLAYGVSLSETGEFESAEEVLLELLNEKTFQKLDLVYFALGRLYWRWGKKKKAVDVFESMIKKFPKSKYVSKAKYFIKQFKEASPLVIFGWLPKKITWAKIGAVSGFATAGVCYTVSYLYDKGVINASPETQDTRAWGFYYASIGSLVVGTFMLVNDFLFFGREGFELCINSKKCTVAFSKKW